MDRPVGSCVWGVVLLLESSWLVVVLGYSRMLVHYLAWTSWIAHRYELMAHWVG